MTLRVQQGVDKFLIESETELRVSQGAAKFMVDSGVAAELRVSSGVVKFPVRTVPRRAIAKIVPPSMTTQARAPYVRR